MSLVSKVAFLPVHPGNFAVRRPLSVRTPRQRFELLKRRPNWNRSNFEHRPIVASAAAGSVSNGIGENSNNRSSGITPGEQKFDAAAQASVASSEKSYVRFGKLLFTDKRLLILTLLAGFIASVCTAIQPILFGSVVAVLAKADTLGMSVSRKLVLRGVLKMAICYFFEASMTFVYVSLSTRVTNRATRKLREQVFRSTIQNDIGYFDGAGRTEIERNVTNSIKVVRDGIWGNLSRDRGLRSILEVVLGLCMCVAATGTVGAPIFAVLVPILSTTVARTGLWTGRQAAKVEKKESDIRFFVNERMRGLRTMKAFGAEEREMKQLGSVLDDAQVPTQRFGYARAITESANRASIYSTICTYFIFGGLLICSGRISYQTFSYLTGYVWILNFAMQGIPYTLTDVGKVTKALDDIYEVIDGAKSYKLKAKASVLSPTIPAKFDGEIRFENVCFSYPSRPNVPVLKDVSFSIKPGQTVALVGDSGGGKSTLASLLSRFYAPSSGYVWVDGVDIHSLPKKVYTKLLAVVDQEPVLFEGTIRDNIAYGLPSNEVNDDDIIQAAKEANAHAFIENLPDGYDTVWSPGSNISGGQRQRIAIARSLIKSPQILVLDEATSALDQESERIVQQSLDRIMKNRTVLVIAHRLSTVRTADQILFVQDGQILERGTYDELLANPNGLFRNLVNAANSRSSQQELGITQ